MYCKIKSIRRWNMSVKKFSVCLLQIYFFIYIWICTRTQYIWLMVGNWMTQWKTNSVFILQMYFRLKCPFWWNYLSRESGVKIQVKRKTNKKNNFNWCFSLFFTCPYIIQLLRTLFQADGFWRMKCVTFFFFFFSSQFLVHLPTIILI